MGYRLCWGVLLSQRRHLLWVWEGTEVTRTRRSPAEGPGPAGALDGNGGSDGTTAPLEDPASCLQVPPQAGPCAQGSCLSPEPKCA